MLVGDVIRTLHFIIFNTFVPHPKPLDYLMTLEYVCYACLVIIVSLVTNTLPHINNIVIHVLLRVCLGKLDYVCFSCFWVKSYFDKICYVWVSSLIF